jgi:hypothetical protein
VNWELFSRGQLFSRVYVHKKDGKPTLLSPFYVASFSSYGDPDFHGRALATLRSLRSALREAERPPVLLSAYDLKRRLGTCEGNLDTKNRTLAWPNRRI